MGVNIGTCKYCGKLFRQNKTNRIQYCYKHRGYQKKGLRFGTCIDCGKEFSIAATNNKKIRCDECQEKKHKEDVRKCVQKYRNKTM